MAGSIAAIARASFPATCMPLASSPRLFLCGIKTRIGSRGSFYIFLSCGRPFQGMMFVVSSSWARRLIASAVERLVATRSWTTAFNSRISTTLTAT